MRQARPRPLAPATREGCARAHRCQRARRRPALPSGLEATPAGHLGQFGRGPGPARRWKMRCPSSTRTSSRPFRTASVKTYSIRVWRGPRGCGPATAGSPGPAARSGRGSSRGTGQSRAQARASECYVAAPGSPGWRHRHAWRRPRAGGRTCGARADRSGAVQVGHREGRATGIGMVLLGQGTVRGTDDLGVSRRVDLSTR